MRGIHRAIGAIAIVLLAGCGDNSTSPKKSVTGTYTLDNIGGDPLPATLDQEQGYLLEVTAGAITLNSNGTFSDTYTLRETTDTGVNEAPIPCTGTWTQSGNNLTLTETTTDYCGDEGSGTWDGSNTLTVDWGNIGLPAVHKR